MTVLAAPVIALLALWSWLEERALRQHIERTTRAYLDVAEEAIAEQRRQFLVQSPDRP